MTVARRTFRCEPRGKLYGQLLDYAIGQFYTGLIVVRRSEMINESAKAVLRSLDPYTTKDEIVSEWPGTILHSDTARLKQFALEAESVAVLKRAAVGLYDWQHPGLPEDLCLMRPDGGPWLVSIAHEGDGYLDAGSRELDHLSRIIPGLDEILEPIDTIR